MNLNTKKVSELPLQSARYPSKISCIPKPHPSGTSAEPGGVLILRSWNGGTMAAAWRFKFG